MPRGNIPITRRADLAVPITAAQNDATLDSLKAGILFSSEAPDPAFPFGVAADVAGAAVINLPSFFTVRGTYHQIKTPTAVGLPAAVTDALVLVTTNKLRLNSDDGAAVQQAFSQVAGIYTRTGAGAVWGVWVADSVYARKDAAQSFTKAQAVTPVALVDAATIAIDASLSNLFKVVLNVQGATRNLGAPTNLIDGQSIVIRIKQDGTGNRAISFNAIYRFEGGIDPALSTALNATDVLCGTYWGDDNKIDCVLLKGMA